MRGVALQEVNAALLLLGLAVLIVRHRLVRGSGPGSAAKVERVATGALLLLALVGVANYYGFSLRTLTDRKAIEGYDLIHYYLNAKYFDELGYTGLYDAVVVADDETEQRFRKWGVRWVRDLDSSQRKSLTSVRRRADTIKGRFAPERWRQFRHDFRFLRSTMSSHAQRAMLIDHGYNGPPLVQAMAGPLARAVPVEWVKLPCQIDTALVVLMFVLLYRTFGTRTTAVATLWLCCSFSSRWPGIGSGLFRYDWFVALVAACLLLARSEPADGEQPGRGHRVRALGAGALLAYATAVRLFPAVWLFGLGARASWRLVTRREIDRVALLVVAGWLAVSVGLNAFAVSVVGLDNTREFAEDIAEHVEPMNLSQQRMGLGIALSWRGEWSGRFQSRRELHEKWRLVAASAPLRAGIALVALTLLALTIRPRDGGPPDARTSAFDATALGFVPFYFTMIASHYYWIHRLTMVLHHGEARDRRGDHLVALGWLFAVEVFANLLDTITGFRYAVTSITSILLGLYCAWVIATRLRGLVSSPAR